MSAEHKVVSPLKERMDALARDLLGEPNRALSSKGEWRYGQRGSFSVEIAGARSGKWYDHETGVGGGPIELISRERNTDKAGAFRFAEDWLGGHCNDNKLKRKPRAARAEAVGDDEPSAGAQALWERSIAISGTLAERYLREHRGISGTLPEGLRFCRSVYHRESHWQYPTLIVPAIDADGTLRRVQAVYLERDGSKALVAPAKRTFGKGASHVPAIFPGNGKGERFDVILTEGPEDAIALRSVIDGGSVAAALGKGSLAKPAFPAGTQLCIVADRDKDGGGLREAQKAAAEHTIRDCAVWIALPPEGCKDANDLLAKRGADAVRAMVAAAERFAPAAAGSVDGECSAEEASERTRQAVAGFFERVIKGTSLYEVETLAIGIRGTLGLGKTAAVLEQLTRPELADKYINFYAPEHRLNGELLERFKAVAVPGSPYARVVLGREQKMPDGTPMCQKADLVRMVMACGQSVQTHLCRKEPEDGGEPEFCEHFKTCPYQRQRADKGPGIRFLSHAHMFLSGEDNKLKSDANVIDESFWQASLRGCDGAGTHLVMHRLDMVRDVPWEGSVAIDLNATAELAEVSQRCARAIKVGGALEDFKAAGVTAGSAKHAKGLEYRRVEGLAVSPAMPRQRQEEAISGYKVQEALKFARFFDLLNKSLVAGVDPKFFSLRRDVPNKEGVPEDRLHLFWSVDLAVTRAPTLLIDADLEPEIARRFLPQMGDPIIASARLGSYHAVQIIDTVTPKSRLVPDPMQGDAENRRRANRRGELRRLVEVEAAKGKTLLVTYKAAEEAIRAEGEIGNAHFTHWNALRGHDEWKDVDTLIIAGVPQPRESDVERMTRALWYLGDPRPIIPTAEGYQQALRALRMVDGTMKQTKVKVHPDPCCTLLLDQIRAEAMQAVGRARLVHRDPAKPCRVIILTNYALPMPVHELSTWDGVMPNPVQVMVARGMVPGRLRDIAKVLPELVESNADDPRRAVHNALKAAGISPSELSIIPYRIYSIGKRGQFVRFRYRLEGERKAACAWVDVMKHVDAKAAVEAVLGPLDRFEPIEGALPEGDPAPNRCDTGPYSPSIPARSRPAMRWLERLRAAEKTSHTLRNELPKLPKGASGSFVGAHSQVCKVFHACICVECGRAVAPDEPETWWGVDRVHRNCGERAWRSSVGVLLHSEQHSPRGGKID